MCRKIKMLYILNIANRVNNFSKVSMLAAQNHGIEFHIAGNWSYSSQDEIQEDENRYGIKIHQIEFIREPYDLKNIKIYSQLKKLVESEQYDVIHSNTPIVGVIGRVVGKACNIKTNIYQAHGFHFYKGAPLLNWIIYYTAEWLCSWFTDCLITINQEDYERARRHMHAKKICYVPGVGVDLTKFQRCCIDYNVKRKELGITDKDIVLLSVGEINKNKNHSVIIKALAELNRPDIHYFIAGKGDLRDELLDIAKNLGVESQVHLLGHRSDIDELCKVADIFCFPSIREGLPVSVMEAMATGLPCVASNIRGNIDLIEDGKGGFLHNPNDFQGFAQSIEKISSDKNLQKKMKEYNLQRIKKFGLDNVKYEMEKIYDEVLK